VVSATPAAVLQPLMANHIVPAYQAMLTTQLQALQFLFLALAQTVESPQLATYNGYLTAELQAMQAYFAYFAGTGADVGAGYDAFMLQELGKYGRKVTTPAELTSYYPYDSSGDCPNKSWPYGTGWLSFDGANVGTARIAYLNLSGATPMLVTLSKMGEWTGCGHPPNYVKPFVFGWNWSGSGAVTLPTAASKAAPVVTAIATAFLGGAPNVTISAPTPAPPAAAPALSTATPEATRTATPGASHTATPGGAAPPRRAGRPAPGRRTPPPRGARPPRARATPPPPGGAAPPRQAGRPAPGRRTPPPRAPATPGRRARPPGPSRRRVTGSRSPSQPAHVQATFQLHHGAAAGTTWVTEHEAELDRLAGPRG
jgi:hypothetical protein